MRLLRPLPPERLYELPNVTPDLLESLWCMGMYSTEALETLGAEATWELLRLAGLDPDVQTLLALEGAIERRPWQDVPAERRFQLMQFFVERAA